MKPASQSIVFSHTPVSIAVAIGFVLIVAGLAFFAWRRSGYRRSTGLLEAIRVFIAICIAVTLNQPEWREIFLPECKPTVVILADSSHSMETRDVIDPANPSAGPCKIAAPRWSPRLLTPPPGATSRRRWKSPWSPSPHRSSRPGGGHRSEQRAGAGCGKASAAFRRGALERWRLEYRGASRARRHAAPDARRAGVHGAAGG